MNYFVSNLKINFMLVYVFFIKNINHHFYLLHFESGSSRSSEMFLT